jgi:hypothetical protein
MLHTHKMLVALIAVSCASSSVFAYKFTFLNDTKDTLNMRFKLMGNDRWWEHTIAPGKQAEQDLPDAYLGKYFCVEAVQIGEHVHTGSVSSEGNAIEAYTTVWKNTPMARVCKHASFAIIKDEEEQLQVIAK